MTICLEPETREQVELDFMKALPRLKKRHDGVIFRDLQHRGLVSSADTVELCLTRAGITFVDQQSSKLSMLPKTLSDLLEMALNDAQKISRRQDYKLSSTMSEWHAPRFYSVDGKPIKLAHCVVCLAGSVMARFVDKESISSPSDLYHDNIINKLDQCALLAIDQMRQGDVIHAAHYLGIGHEVARQTMSWPESLKRTITPHNTSKRAFFTDLRKLVRDLRTVNL